MEIVQMVYDNSWIIQLMLQNITVYFNDERDYFVIDSRRYSVYFRLKEDCLSTSQLTKIQISTILF